MSDDELSGRAATLHRDALVWDNHCCIPFEQPGRWLGVLERYRLSGVDVVMINIGDSRTPLETCVRMAGEIRAYIKVHPADYVLALTADSILQAKSERKLAVGLDVEGVYSIGEQLSLIDLYYDLGVRWMLMVYNRRATHGPGGYGQVLLPYRLPYRNGRAHRHESPHHLFPFESKGPARSSAQHPG